MCMCVRVAPADPVILLRYKMCQENRWMVDFEEITAEENNNIHREGLS